VHGFCGIWGCIAIAFFAKDIGILYGHADSGKLLGYQILGCLCIAVWSGGLSAIFFLIANGMDVFRMSEKHELIGGDLHYFGPRELDVQLSEIDLKSA
jgi:ammonium transporter, Amt family